MGEWVGRLGGREAQSAMMRWDSFLHLRGPGCEGHPVELPSPTVAISKPQSSSFQKPPLPWPIPLQLPRGPGWEAGDSGYGPCLTQSKLGRRPKGGRGGYRLLGCLVPLGAVAGVLTPVTPETPPLPWKSQGAEESPYSLLLAPNLAWSNSAGKESIVRLVAPAYTALLWRAGVRVGWGGSNQV